MADNDDLPPPPVTDEMRERAHRAPNTWLYCIDPFFAGAESTGQGVPPFGIVGAYQVDGRGEIAEGFTPNPNYQPSPLALGLSTPTNPVEEALQLAATGYGGEAQLREALLTGSVFTARDPNGFAVFDEGEGRHAVRAYTSERYVPEQPVDPGRWQRVSVPNLLPVLRGRFLSLNPATELAVMVPGEALV